MLISWIRKALKAREAARRDALALLQTYGDDAFRVARDRARDARWGSIIDADRDGHHWDRVRAHLGRRTNREKTDTATRMLENRK